MVGNKLACCTILITASVSLGGACAAIEFEKVQLSDQFFSEGAAHGDYDGDGQGDVAIGPWIYHGPDFERKQRFYAGDAIDPAGYSKNFLMFTDDVNTDGHADILVIGFPGAESWWYENPGKPSDALWKQHVMLDSVANESPLIADIDGDGVKDLICCSGGHYVYASHAGQDPTLPWKVVQVSPNNGYQRFTHGVGAGDVNNDGLIDLIEKNGWWQNPGKPVLSGEFWGFHEFKFADEAAQMYAVDFDGDGKNEVLTSVHAHGFGLVYWKSKNDKGTDFERVEIMGDSAETSSVGIAISQLHGVDVADVNGDGIKDIVTGKRWWAHKNKDAGNMMPATLVWFETRRLADRVTFIPHVIDVGSGVGTQVTAGDVNGDGRVDIVCGVKRGGYLFLQKPAAGGRSMVPGLAARDPFGQATATEVFSDDERLLPAIAGRPLDFGFDAQEEHHDWEARGPIANSCFKSMGEESFLATHPDQPKAVGEVISRPFLIPASKLNFVGGGTPDAASRVEIVLAESGRIAARWPSEVSDAQSSSQNASSENASSENASVSLDLGAFVGRPARIRIIDHSEAGYLQVDDFYFSK